MDTLKAAKKKAIVRRYRFLMVFLFLIYSAGTVLLYLYHYTLYEVLLKIPYTFEPFPLPEHPTIMIFFCSLLVNLSFLCFLSFLFPRAWSFQLVHLSSSLTLSALFLGLFLQGYTYWLYLILGSFQGFISILLTWTLLRFMISRPFKTLDQNSKMDLYSPSVNSLGSSNENNSLSMSSTSLT